MLRNIFFGSRPPLLREGGDGACLNETRTAKDPAAFQRWAETPLVSVRNKFQTNHGVPRISIGWDINQIAESQSSMHKPAQGAKAFRGRSGQSSCARRYVTINEPANPSTRNPNPIG
jgi:hypothetical protein